MERTYLQWNIVNWITVVLMATLGVSLIGVVAAALQTYKLPSSSAE